MKNEGLVRNRLKISGTVENAKSFLQVKKEWGSFSNYIWSFVDGRPLPVEKRKKAIAISVIMSKDLKKRGFRFVGPTICYAYMQAVGLVNDHSKDCFRSKQV